MFRDNIFRESVYEDKYALVAVEGLGSYQITSEWTCSLAHSLVICIKARGFGTLRGFYVFALFAFGYYSYILYHFDPHSHFK